VFNRVLACFGVFLFWHDWTAPPRPEHFRGFSRRRFPSYECVGRAIGHSAREVAQTAKSAVSRVAKPAGASAASAPGLFGSSAGWQSATQQAWQPALRPIKWNPPPPLKETPNTHRQEQGLAVRSPPTGLVSVILTMRHLLTHVGLFVNINYSSIDKFSHINM
jgi:hypothetical protein